MISDLDNDLNMGWHDSGDYQPHSNDPCASCTHTFNEHDGWQGQCTWHYYNADHDDFDHCYCVGFEP